MFSLVLFLVALAQPAFAQDDRIQVASLNIEGVKEADEGALRNALQTRKGSWLPWGRKRYFDRRAFEADLRRIEAFYRDRGFPSARVRTFDVNLNDTQDKVDITIQIEEGEPIRVADIVLRGFDVLSESEQRDLRGSLPLQPMQPLDRTLAIASRERAINALHDHGYPYAEVTLTDDDESPTSRRVTLAATPGMLALFGPIEIRGQASVDEHVIRRQLLFKAGDRFSRQLMRNSQRKLYALELFEFVNIESLQQAGQQAPEVPARVTVAEGKHRKITTGIGYGTEEQVRARIRWDHVNFFGGARHAGAEAKWSSLDRGVRLDYREPYFFSPAFSLNFEGQAWQAKEPVYSSNRLGGRASLRYQTTAQFFWALGLINEYSRNVVDPRALLDFSIRDDLIALGLDPRGGVEEGTLSGLTFDVTRNTTTSLLDARRGYFLTGHVEQAGTWMWGTFNYRSLSGEARHYLPIARRAVLANKFRLGSIDPVNNDLANVPFYKLYFLGGATSIRGWGRFEVSPLSGFGFPIGGLSLAEGSTELRFPLFGKLGGVVFLDYGNVWADPWQFDLGDLRYAAGPGLRYLTPIGPARFDFGYQLNPIPGLRVGNTPPDEQRHWRIHFSIGQAF